MITRGNVRLRRKWLNINVHVRGMKTNFVCLYVNVEYSESGDVMSWSLVECVVSGIEGFASGVGIGREGRGFMLRGGRWCEGDVNWIFCWLYGDRELWGKFGRH
jgi:hypothetical protein